MTNLPKTISPAHAVVWLDDKSDAALNDPEQDHGDCDRMLLAVLRHAGPEYAAVADAWERARENIGFWYA